VLLGDNEPDSGRAALYYVVLRDSLCVYEFMHSRTHRRIDLKTCVVP